MKSGHINEGVGRRDSELGGGGGMSELGAACSLVRGGAAEVGWW